MQLDDPSPLLICLDLEAGSEQLLAYAAHHVRRCQQTVRVLHVSRAELDAARSDALQQQIRKLLDRVFPDISPPAIDIEVGLAEDRIVEVAQRCQADPVLLGRRRRATVERIYVGSTTSAVLSLATRPVLVVPVDPSRT